MSSTTGMPIKAMTPARMTATTTTQYSAGTPAKAAGTHNKNISNSSRVYCNITNKHQRGCQEHNISRYQLMSFHGNLRKGDVIALYSKHTQTKCKRTLHMR
jgi:hypothetical protein